MNQTGLLTRVASLLRIKSLYVKVERLSRRKRFFSHRVAEMLKGAGASAREPMQSHRAEITVASIDLRGYTAFTEVAEPEEVMIVLRE